MQQNNLLLYALPGFLGKGDDWECLFRGHILADRLIPIEHDHYGYRQESGHTMREWAKCFNADIASRTSKSCNVLMGYSLGGRLALHALLERPDLWQAGVIISAHPGLSDPLTKEERLKEDQAWAHRFEYEPWEKLMKSWNSRKVLAGSSFEFRRSEEDYKRCFLAFILEKWSLGLQQDLCKKIACLKVPILWLAGDRDPIYADIAREISLSHPRSRKDILSGAGHRLPWETRGAFLRELSEFVSVS